MKTVYISGPMSGLPENNYPAFFRAEEKLRAQGFAVENPARNPKPAPETWEGYMRMAIVQLMRCDAICFLPGRQKSRGAMLESLLSARLGFRIILL